MAPKTKTLAQCMKALRDAMDRLPELGEVAARLPAHHRLDLTVVEDAHRKTLTPNVIYDGFEPVRGSNVYIFGEMIFTSELTLSEIAKKMQDALLKVQDTKDLTYKVADILWNDLGLSDEGYIFARGKAIGTFKLKVK